MMLSASPRVNQAQGLAPVSSVPSAPQGACLGGTVSKAGAETTAKTFGTRLAYSEADALQSPQKPLRRDGSSRANSIVDVEARLGLPAALTPAPIVS